MRKYVIGGVFALILLAGLSYRAFRSEGPKCGQERAYVLKLKTAIEGPTAALGLGEEGFELESQVKREILYRSGGTSLERWTFATEVLRPSAAELRRVMAPSFQGQVWIQRDAEGGYVGFFRPESQSAATTNGLKNFLFPLQFTERASKSYAADAPDGFGVVRFAYSRKGPELIKEKHRYVRYHAGSPPVERSEGRWVAQSSEGSLDSVTGKESLAIPLLSSETILTTETAIELSALHSWRKAEHPPDTCRAESFTDALMAWNVVPVAWWTEVDKEQEARNLKAQAKTMRFEGWETAWQKAKVKPAGNGANPLGLVQSQLTDLLSIDPAAVKKSVVQIRAERNAEKRRFLIGALGGATGASAQAALRELLGDFSQTKADAEWFGFTARANQFSPEPAAENLELLWELAQAKSLRAEERASALYAVATASQRATEASREIYVDKILQMKPQDPQVWEQAVGNLAHPKAFDYFEKLAANATSPEERIRALDGVRLIEGETVDNFLLDQADAAAEEKVKEIAYRSLANRPLSETSAQRLIGAYGISSSSANTRVWILQALSEPHTRSLGVTQEFIQGLRARGLSPLEQNILGPG